MGLLIVVLLLALVLGGAGFAVHALWWIAGIVLILWLLGFFIRPATGGGRWYRW
ncbi:hydrophobic protein [Amycolatopsis sp. NPDC059657]|uniref:hydrophobic protein n=1 Tax=Amycolatopsis sp. NPDC059657 TaxID=3346899 RepID=UPI00366B145B